MWLLSEQQWDAHVCCRSQTSPTGSRNLRRTAAEAAQASARQQRVGQLRKIRIGELPDVQQVAVESFMGPLGGLSYLATPACK